MSAKYANCSQRSAKMQQKQLKKRARNVPKNAAVAQKCRSCRPGRAEGIRQGKSVAAPLPDTWRPSSLSPFPLVQVVAADIGRARVPGCLWGRAARVTRAAQRSVAARGNVAACTVVGVSGRSPDGSEAKLRQPLPPSLLAAACRALVASQPLPGMNAAQACANWGTPPRPGKQIAARPVIYSFDLGGVRPRTKDARAVRGPFLPLWGRDWCPGCPGCSSLAVARAHPLFAYAAK